MKHSNIIDFLSGSVWMATESHVETIRAVADSVISGTNPHLREQFVARQGDVEPTPYEKAGIRIERGVAVYPIHGTIIPKATLMSNYSGGTSAEDIRRNMKTLAADSSVHTIVLDIDSNGGSVNGVDSAASAVRKARKSKRVLAVANYNMNSAAYWIGSAAEKVFVTPTSSIGSIGVISVLQMLPEEDRKRFTVIRSVPGKADANPYEPLTESARKKLQADVDKIHAAFVQAISLNRNISMEQAEQLADGHVDLGADAVESGLADAVVDSVDDVLASIDAMSDQTEQFAAMRSAYEALMAQHADLECEMAEIDTELAEALHRIAELEEAHDVREAADAEARANAVVSAAVRDRKIAPGAAAGFVADLVEGQITFDAFERMVGNISSGAVVPDASLTPMPGATSDPNAPSNDEERRVLAQFPSLKGKF